MKKQEEIREGIEQTIRDSYKELQALNKLDPVTHNIDKAIRVVLFEQSTKAITRLHSQGVVIKVKCPDCAWGQFGEESVGMTPCYSCNSTGYIFKPIIEDKDD